VPLNYPAPSPCCSIQNYTDESRPYTVGPSVEFRLPAGFAIEIDALYRRLGLRDSGLTAFTSYDAFTDRWRGNAWEFPLLGKYYFRKRERWQPFAGAGMGMRYLSRDAMATTSAPLDRSTRATIPTTSSSPEKPASPGSDFVPDAFNGFAISLHSLERIRNPDRSQRSGYPSWHCLLRGKLFEEA
jgi:hypothetical protein